MVKMGTMERDSGAQVHRPGIEGLSHDVAAQSNQIPRFARWQSTVIILVAIHLSGILAYDYYWRVENPSMDRRIALHRDILDGSAPYEYRYRVLIPEVADAIAQIIQSSPVASSEPKLTALPYSRKAFEIAYVSLDFMAFAVLLWSVAELLRRLFDYPLALFGMALSSFLVNFTFRDHYFHPWSFWEGAFFAAGLLLLHQERYWLFSVIGIVGVFNRDTSLFLLLAFLFYTLPERLTRRSLADLLHERAFRFALGNLIVWTAGFFLLRLSIGYKPAVFSVETAWKGNSEHWPYALILNLLLFGPMWVWVVRGIPISPLLIRRAAMIIPLYIGLLLVIGYWWEIRYWISLIPILVPGLIAAISKISLRTAVVNS